jgi:hypothetical protein
MKLKFLQIFKKIFKCISWNVRPMGAEFFCVNWRTYIRKLINSRLSQYFELHQVKSKNTIAKVYLVLHLQLHKQQAKHNRTALQLVFPCGPHHHSDIYPTEVTNV